MAPVRGRHYWVACLASCISELSSAFRVSVPGWESWCFHSLSACWNGINSEAQTLSCLLKLQNSSTNFHLCDTSEARVWGLRWRQIEMAEKSLPNHKHSIEGRGIDLADKTNNAKCAVKPSAFLFIFQLSWNITEWFIERMCSSHIPAFWSPSQ